MHGVTQKKRSSGPFVTEQKPYEKNSHIHSSLHSGNVERRIAVTAGVVYGLDGSRSPLEAAPRNASGYV
jgi:hypothetical protein